MKYTGERFIPNCDGPEIEAEHVHRYRVVAGFTKNMRVLDAGCGTGYGSFILAQSAEWVTGIDISNETIQWCKEHYGAQDNLTFVQTSIEELPFNSEEFDCIINLEVIEHVDKNVQIAFLKEAKRVLKPTGILIMSTPNKSIYTDKSGYHNPYHVCEFYPDEFKSYLADEFEAIKIYNQSLYLVSTILDETIEDAKVPIIKNNDIDSSEKYMIAVCGNSQDSISLFDLSSVYKYDNPMGTSIASLYVATKGNSYSQQFKQSNVLTARTDNQFSITFDITQYSEASQFRFDPIENYFCVCDIQESLSDGKIESILPLNALEYHKTGFVFMNVDPQFEIKGDFSGATYLTLNGYFKVMSQNEISEFVDAFYNKMITLVNESKNAFSSEQLTSLFDETKMKISEQGTDLHNIQTMLSKHQSALLTSNRMLQYQEELINNAHKVIIEEKTLMSTIAAMVTEQGELLKDTRNLIMKQGRISRVFQKAYHLIVKLFKRN